MGEEVDAPIAAYVQAAAQLTRMPLSAERLVAVAGVMTRIAGFAVHLGDFALADDVEVAGIFTP